MRGIALSLLIAGLLGAATPVLAQTPVESARRVAVAAPDPAVQVLEVARLLRGNDLAGLIQATVPPEAYEKMRAEYELGRVRPISDKDRAKFAEEFAKFTAPDSVDRLMAEIEPKLVEARPKLPAALMMGLGAAQMAVLSEDSDLSADQRASLQQALPALQQWLTTTDFLSSESARQALSVVAEAVRGTGIQSIDELRRLSFEQALAKADAVLAAGKQALQVYGLDVNAIADSIRVEVLSIEGSTARVRTTFTVFNAPVSSEHELVLLNGRWYGRHALEHDHNEGETTAQG